MSTANVELKKLKIKCNRLIDEALRLQAENRLRDQQIEKLEEKKRQLEQKKEQEHQQAQKIEMVPAVVEAPISTEQDVPEVITQGEDKEVVAPTFTPEKVMDMIEALSVLYDDYKSGQEMDAKEQLDRDAIGADNEVVVIYERGSGIFRRVVNFILLVLGLILLGGALLFVSEIINTYGGAIYGFY